MRGFSSGVGESSSEEELSSKVEESALWRGEELAGEGRRSGLGEWVGLIWEAMLLDEAAFLMAVVARLLFEGALVTVTALGTPRRATMGLIVLFMGKWRERSMIGTGGVAERGVPIKGLFLPLDFTATGLALPRMAVWAGKVFTTALPR